MNRTELRARMYATYLAGDAPQPETLEDLRPRLPYLRRLVAQHFPPDRGAAILELGCGYGALVHVAREAGYGAITGVDGSPTQVEAAQRLGIAGVRHGDLWETLRAQGDATLDAVVAFDVLEHCVRDELVPFADEVHRVLRPAGRWIVHTCNGESPFGGRSRYGDLTHELAFTPRSMGQLMRACGFEHTASFEDAPVVHGVKSAARWLLWRGFSALMKLYLLAETGTAGSGILTQNFLTVAWKATRPAP